MFPQIKRRFAAGLAWFVFGLFCATAMSVASISVSLESKSEAFHPSHENLKLFTFQFGFCLTALSFGISIAIWSGTEKYRWIMVVLVGLPAAAAALYLADNCCPRDLAKWLRAERRALDGVGALPDIGEINGAGVVVFDSTPLISSTGMVRLRCARQHPTTRPRAADLKIAAEV